MDDKETLNRLKYLINKHRSIEEICDDLDIDIYDLYEMVLFLKMHGQRYDIVDQIPVKVTSKVNKKAPLKLENKKTICLLSDLHYGSIYERPDIIRYIYRQCEEREIDSIFCSGDLTNGNYPHREGYQELCHTYEANEIIDYVCSVHPRINGITFYTISGNHDDTYRNNDGIDICKEIAKERNDIVYLGKDTADIYFDGLKMRIAHGCGRKRISIEERLIRMFEALSEEERPDLFQIGHIHHSMYLPYMGCHIFQTAALMDQTPIDRKNNFLCERSCWFVNLDYDAEGKICSVKPEIQTFGPKRIHVKK